MGVLDGKVASIAGAGRTILSWRAPAPPTRRPPPMRRPRRP